MTLTLGSRPHHLEDGDLVRYVDRQMDRAGSRRAELHLAACAECAARLEAMQSRSQSVTAWLGELDVPVPDDEKRALAMATVERARFRARPHAWTSRPSLAAAAMVALLLTAAFGTAPGRAWVSGAVERLGAVLPGEAAQEQAAAAPAQTPSDPVLPPSTATADEAEPSGPRAVVPSRPRRPVLPPGMSEAVAFNPTGNYVLLKFDSRQRMGSATIWVKDIPGASGQVVAGRQSETLVPTPDGLLVRNAGASRADYTVEIPTRYRFIRVQIGDEPETVIAVSRARRDWLWTVSLTDSGA